MFFEIFFLLLRFVSKNGKNSDGPKLSTNQAKLFIKYKDGSKQYTTKKKNK